MDVQQAQQNLFPAIPLRGRQERFCIEFAVDANPNATKTYQKVYNKDMTSATASAASSRLMSDPNIRARIEYLREEQARRLGIDKFFIFDKIKHLAVNAFSEKTQLEALKTLASLTNLEPTTRIDVKAEVKAETSGIITLNALDLAKICESGRANPNIISAPSKNP